MVRINFLFIFAAFLSVSFCMRPKSRSFPTLTEIAESAEGFEIFQKLLDITNLTETFFALKDVTIFAPDDRAFIRRGRQVCEGDIKTNADFLECVTTSFSNETISSTLLYHVVPKTLPFDKLVKRRFFKTLQGSRFLRRNLELIDLSAGFGNAFLDARGLDIFFDGGVIHLIDRVLLPFVNVLPSQPCLLIESPLITVVGGNKRFVFVSVNSLLNASKKCDGFADAIKECETENVCQVRDASKMLPGGITIGDVFAAAATCKKAAVFVAKCAGDTINM